jgi:hypothetical protein
VALHLHQILKIETEKLKDMLIAGCIYKVW